jgi:hypothetical protein
MGSLNKYGTSYKVEIISGGRCASMDATYPPKLLGNPGPAAYSSLHHHEDPIPQRSLPSGTQVVNQTHHVIYNEIYTAI